MRQGPALQVAVVGAGAVGSLLGGCLALDGHRVTLVGRVAGTSTGDLELVLDGRVRSTRVERIGPNEELRDPLDVAIIAVKRYDLPAALDRLAARPAAIVVTVQNGIGAEEEALAARPSAPLLAASLTAAVELGPAGEVRWETRGGIGLAPVAGDAGQMATRLAGAFVSSGLRASVFPDAGAMKWSKLVANLVGNATSALLALDVAAILADRRTYEIELAQHREALSVMTALGLRPVRLPGADIPLLVRGFALPPWLARPVLGRALGGARGGKMPSIQAAVLAGSRTEVEWLNGAVAGMAARLGVPAPINAGLCRLVLEAAADPTARRRFEGRPDRLVDALSGVVGT